MLKTLIEEHVAETNSRWGATLLSNWETKREHFWQIVPKEMINKLEHPIQDAAEEKATA